MTARPLRCPRCGSAAAVIERVTAVLDWGLATIGADGVVRPVGRDAQPPCAMADNAEGAEIPYGRCDDSECLHQWRLRQRFDPTALLDTPNPEGQ
jgi:hypothetical protein